MSKHNDQRTTSGVPPAPTLTFPTMYNGKKFGKKPQSAMKAAKRPGAPDCDPITGRLPQSIHDLVTDIEDFRVLGRDKLNEEFVAKVPLRLLLAASQGTRDSYLASSPSQPLASLNIETANENSKLYKDALKLTADWMRDSCTKFKAYYISPSNFAININLIAVANVMGMDIYVNHITKKCTSGLRYGQLTLRQLATISNAAPSADFAPFACVIKRLSHELVKGERSKQDPESLQWMQQCPRLSETLKVKYDQQLLGYRNKQQALADKKRRAEEKADLEVTARLAREALKAQHEKGKRQEQEEED